MKKIPAFIFVLLFTGTLIFNSCNKYEDGANLSMRTKKARTEGDWNITSATQGTNNLFNYSYVETSSAGDPGCFDEFTYTVEHSIPEWQWNLKASGEFHITAVFKKRTIDYGETILNCTLVYGDFSTTVVAQGKWEFDDKKEKIKFTYDSYTKDGVLQNGTLFSDGTTGTTEEFDIVELRNKTMHLSGTINAKEVDLIFEQ